MMMTFSFKILYQTSTLFARKYKAKRYISVFRYLKKHLKKNAPPNWWRVLVFKIQKYHPRSMFYEQKHNHEQYIL